MAADPLTSRTADELLEANAAFDSDNEDLTERPPITTTRDDKAILSPRKRKAGDDLRDEIVDEEVRITKQRRKIPKLDTDKLISEPGLPKIRNLMRTGQLKKRLRLKGKGHEFSDTARLLNFYQMWLDNLYPRAKFADAVQMVEKAGHTKKLQMYRKSWIDEGKPGAVRREDMDDAFDKQDMLAETTTPEQHVTADVDIDVDFDEDPSSMFFEGADQPAGDALDGPDDDELDALLAQETNTGTSRKLPIDIESEGEDDLDAILAQEQTHRRDVQPASTQRHIDSAASDGDLREASKKDETTLAQRKEDHASATEADEDDLDALLKQDTSDEPANSEVARQNPAARDDEQFGGDDLDDMDDWEGVLTKQPTTTEPELPENVQKGSVNDPSDSQLPGSEEVPELENAASSSSPIPNVHTDELDQLLDEHDAIVEQRKKQADPDILEEFFSSSPLEN